ncbi:MAG: hypothetical protein AAGD38_18915 [Acidobacteriota bacterium]
MSTSLLSAFASEEATAYAQDLIHSVLRAARAGTGPTRIHLAFNRFEVTLDTTTNEALIEDVLDATETGELRTSIDELLAAFPLKP